MEIIERISEICRKNGTTVTKLEAELGYSNGSLAKAKDIPSSRILDISKRFHIPMNYIMTGELEEFTPEQARLDLRISQDLELKSAIEKYYSLSEKKQKHVIELIELLAEEE